MLSYKIIKTPSQSCWGQIRTRHTMSLPDNNHKLGDNFNRNLLWRRLKAFPFSIRLVSHLYIHTQHCSGLIKHVLSDCLPCLWFSSFWLQPLWPGLILSILCWEITRGWQDWEEERKEKWVAAFPCNKQDWAVKAVMHPSVFLLLFLSLCSLLTLCSISHSHFFFFPLSHLLSFSSSLSLPH